MIKMLTTPLTWVVLFLLLGLILWKWPRRRIGRRAGQYLVAFGTLVLWAFSFPPFANVLIYGLERRTPIPTKDILSTLDVIVVLGGGGYASGGFRREADLSGGAYPRLYQGVRLFKQGHAKWLALSGGAIGHSPETEAGTMKTMAIRLGVAESSILTEETSRNTMENAEGLVNVLAPLTERRIGLVTSATHMPRAFWAFKQRFPQNVIVPIPVHHRYNPTPWHLGNLRPSVSALETSTVAIHEYIGLLWYAVRY